MEDDQRHGHTEEADALEPAAFDHSFADHCFFDHVEPEAGHQGENASVETGAVGADCQEGGR